VIQQRRHFFSTSAVQVSELSKSFFLKAVSSLWFEMLFSRSFTWLNFHLAKYDDQLHNQKAQPPQ
jgi:hypothetical protein